MSWTEELFEESRSLLRNKMLKGTYSLSNTLELENLMRNNMSEWIAGGRTLVIGSQVFLICLTKNNHTHIGPNK